MAPSIQFRPATRRTARLRLALDGPAGSGKTFTALSIATYLLPGGGRIAVADSERESALKYALTEDEVTRGVRVAEGRFAFDHLPLDTHSPDHYRAVIAAAEAAHYDVLVIDSLSHAWMGRGGALEMVDQKANGGDNSFTAWRHVTPKHNQLVDAILGAKLHIIATLRTKTEYVLEDEQRGTRTVKVPRKVGLAPVQRDGMEYEFDLVIDMADAIGRVSKSRCLAVPPGSSWERPGVELAGVLRSWLLEGGSRTEPTAPPQVSPPQSAPIVSGVVAPITQPPQSTPLTATTEAQPPQSKAQPAPFPGPPPASDPDAQIAFYTAQVKSCGSLPAFDELLAEMQSTVPQDSPARAVLRPIVQERGAQLIQAAKAQQAA